ncbi:hypothetical protein [Flavisphingomonas formosensis]|uniref:hypothetical protein n=1 Tax=Flavisphingomonas formosensis TaxID=861534 RepID=UPI0018DF0B6E|nr:hypothetical protein [Sphingomonas formosensis]
MARSKQPLPEGTDAILDTDAGITQDGAETLSPSEGKAASAKLGGAKSAMKTRARAALKSIGDEVGKEAADIKKQASGKARELASQGKEKAVSTLDGATSLIDDAAGAIDSKLGEQYGDYARKASEAVASIAASLRTKEVEDLIEDARSFVKKSPAVAIGAAIAVGFVVSRLVKAGADEDGKA